MKFILELHKGCWLAPTQRWGDPSRTWIVDHARIFISEESALRVLKKVRKNWPRKGYKSAKVLKIKQQEVQENE